jgi:hypothetical protein
MLSEIQRTKKFQNKYRIQSARLPHWNYSRNGYYFVTICTKDRISYFGEIIGKGMRLSKIGEIAEKFWRETPKHFQNTELDEFIV